MDVVLENEKLLISVEGPPAKQQPALNAFRWKLDRTHRFYPESETEEWVPLSDDQTQAIAYSQRHL